MWSNGKHLIPQKKQISELQTKDKKSIITLSLDEEILDEVKEEADKAQLSLSSKVSNILSKYIVTYKVSLDIKSVFVTQNTFKVIVDKMDEELLSEDFMNNALDFIPTLFYAKNISFTLDNIIRYALTGAALDGGIYNQFHHYKDLEGFIHLVMRHNFGLKWSKILSRGQSKLIESMLNCHTSSTILPSSVNIKIAEKNIIYTI